MQLWTNTRTLSKPIGKWMVPSSQLYRKWPAYYEFSTSCITDTKWTPTDTSTTAHIYMTDGMITIEEVDCSGVVGNVQIQQDGTFQMSLDFLEDWESSLLQNVNTLHPIHEIFAAIGEKVFIIATDESSGDTLMSFGWKISDHKGTMLVQHAGPAFGQASSFWSEAYRILSVILFLHYTKEYVQYKEQVGFKLYLDNESVITWIKTQQQYPYDYSFNTLTPVWDIIAHIVAVLCRSDISGEFEHVKGHQDKERKYEDLPIPAQMNVDVSILAVA
eukprot:13624578-Ditylum_brightwellii.AAC.1